MIAIVGTFERLDAAVRAARDLHALGGSGELVYLFRNGDGAKRLGEVPPAESEGPGMARTMLAFLLCAIGVAAGLELGAVAAGLMAPEAAPVMALGLLGAAMLGIAGLVCGNIAGKKVVHAVFEGLPEDDFFVYRDALRQGRAVVVCLARKQAAVAEARLVLEHEGAEAIDAARHMWKLGWIDAMLLRYSVPVRAKAEQDPFVRGYEAALNPEFRGKPWDQVVYLLAERYKNWYDDAFRRGFDGGQRNLSSAGAH